MKHAATSTGTTATDVHWTKLGEITDGPGQYGTSQKASRSEIGIPVLRMGNVRDGRLVWDDLRYMSLSREEESKYRLAPGDILFNRTNSAELVGKSALFDGARDAVFASYLIRFRARRTLVEPNYLCAYINSPLGRAFIAANMARAIGQVNISASTMKRMPIPLPPLPEQRRVVAQLSDQIGMLTKVRAAMDRQALEASRLHGSLLLQAFGESWPMRRLADVAHVSGGDPEDASSLPDVFPSAVPHRSQRATRSARSFEARAHGGDGRRTRPMSVGAG